MLKEKKHLIIELSLISFIVVLLLISNNNYLIKASPGTQGHPLSEITADSNFSMEGHKITNLLLTPSVDSDAATKNYVDTKINGNWVPSNIKLSSVTHNGNFGGWGAMYTWLQSNGCSGYHLCSPDEITNWAQQGNNINFLDGARVSIQDFNGGLDCSGWTSSSGNAIRIEFSLGFPRFYYVQNGCTNSLLMYMACCSNN